MNSGAPVTASLSDTQVERYSRQIILREIGATGQRRLLGASVVVAGSSAIAVAAARYLAAAGIGRHGLTDPALIASAAVNPDTNADILPLDAALDDAIRSFGVIVDAGSPPAIVARLNASAVVRHAPLVLAAGSAAGGYLATLAGPHPDAPCAACLGVSSIPAIPPDDLPAGIADALIGALAATEAVKCVLDLGSPLYGHLLRYDAHRAVFETEAVARNPACRVCAVSTAA